MLQAMGANINNAESFHMKLYSPKSFTTKVWWLIVCHHSWTHPPPVFNESLILCNKYLWHEVVVLLPAG